MSAAQRRVARHEAGHAIVSEHFWPGSVTRIEIDALGGRCSYSTPIVNELALEWCALRSLAPLGARLVQRALAGRAATAAFLDLRDEDADLRVARQVAEVIARKKIHRRWCSSRRRIARGGGASRFDVDPAVRERFVERFVDRLLLEAFGAARLLVREHRRSHTWLFEALLERGSLTGDEVRQVIKGLPLSLGSRLAEVQS